MPDRRAYLRNTYVENSLKEPGKIVVEGEALDLRRVKLDVYAVRAEDHIVPWDAAWQSSRLVGREVTLRACVEPALGSAVNPPLEDAPATAPRRRHSM